MQVVDTVMAGHYSATDLAGISLASSLIMPLMILMIGTITATTPIVAQLFGAQKLKDVGVSVRQAFWLALLMVIPIIIILANLSPVLGLFDVPDHVAVISLGYLNIIILGYPAWAMFLVLRTTCEGLGQTKPPMYITVFALLCNIPLNYMFIFGKFGAPEMGGVGCAVATVIVMWVQLGAILVVIAQHRYREVQILKGSWRPEWKLIGEHLRIGLPIGLKIFGPVGVFAISPLFIARFGEIPVAAGTIGGNITTLAFLVPIGFATAATIRVGQAVGEGDLSHAKSTGETAVIGSMVGALFIGIGMYVFREPLAALYTNDPALIEMTAALLALVAVYQFSDAAQEPAVGALRGYKDTAAAMWFSICSYWLLALPIGTLLAYGYVTEEPMTVFGYWLAFILAETIVAILANWRLRIFATRGERTKTGTI